MKAFFEEYGFIILVCVVVIALVGIAVALKPLMSKTINGIVETLGNKAESALNADDFK